MTHPSRQNDMTLDDAVAAVRDDAAPASVAEIAAARVWERLAAPAAVPARTVDAIRGCADVQALLAAHRRGELTAARALLVDDHVRECPACRAALQRPGARRLAVLPWRPSSAAAASGPNRFRPHAVAASVLLVVGLCAWAVREAFFGLPPGSRAVVQSVSGGLHRLAGQPAVALAPGGEVGEGEAVRTARGSRAVLRLRDGSIVEMGERAELSVSARAHDTTIHLARGSIIVQAAPRRGGHLRVVSSDVAVNVTGTVFSVNRGIKGSRVSVLEGQVRVVRGGDEQVLAPGDQWATSAAMGGVPLREEIAWSGELDRHLALLGELKALRERWRAVPAPGLRYESRLLRVVPAEAVLFASLPNYGETLADAHRLFQERLQESAVLREWWAEADPARHGGPSLDDVIDKVRAFADFLGDEVVLAAVSDRGRRGVLPLVVAEVRRPGLREFLESELARIGAGEGDRSAVRLVDGTVARPSTAGAADVFVLLRPDLILVSPDGGALQALSNRLDGAPGGLDRTPFGARLAQAYGDGVGLLFAADLDHITSQVAGGRTGRDAQRADALSRAGIDGLRYLILERKDVGDQAHTQAVLAFKGAPRGIPSWLAAPAPMGSLDFVSPNAHAAAAFVVKSPALIFNDIVALATASRARAREELAELESKLELRLREDLAETLGGEFALALDGPLLPTPAWKFVIEVYDPARLQASLQLLVSRANDEALRTGRPGFHLEAEQVGTETYYALRGGLPIELHYALAEGYLVAAPSRALVMKAIRTRASSETLARSASFRALFPPDRDVNVSGVVYQNLGTIVGSLLAVPGAGSLSPDQRRSYEALARDARPTLLCAYGEEGAIRVAGMGGVFDLDASDLALPMLLERVIPGTRSRAAPRRAKGKVSAAGPAGSTPAGSAR